VLTTTGGLPYPEQTDSVDVVRDVKALADALDLKLMRAWTVYSPTFGDLTPGNASVVARYQKIGKTVHYAGSVTLGATTVMNPNPPQISLPFLTVATGSPLGSAYVTDASAGLTFPGVPVLYAAGYFVIRVPNGLAMTGVVPFTWAPPDVFAWNMTYETTAAA